MKKHFFSFLKSSKASSAVEFAICLPLLVTAFLGMWDLVNYCMAKAKAQNQAMIFAQFLTDPKFSLTASFYRGGFGDFHNETNTFGLEQIIKLLSVAEDGRKYTYSGNFLDSSTLPYGNILITFTGNTNGAGNVNYGTAMPSTERLANKIPIEITVTYSISAPFLQFAFPKTVQGIAYSYPLTGHVNCVFI